METPFLSGCGKDTASNTVFSWQTDTISAPSGGTSGNRALEGNEATKILVHYAVTHSCKLRELREPRLKGNPQRSASGMM